MIVPRARLAEVERIAREAASGDRGRRSASPKTTHGPIANRAQFDRVQAMIGAGIDEGAKLVCGGPGRPEGLERGFYARPTIFSDVRPQHAHRAGGDIRPGAGHHPLRRRGRGGGDRQRHRSTASARMCRARPGAGARVAARIRAGQVHINYPAWEPHAPFGGYKQSGNGREYGVFGMEEYLETKAILGYCGGHVPAAA